MCKKWLNLKLDFAHKIHKYWGFLIKYAQATTIEIELSIIENNIILTIEDNRKGFLVDEKNNGLGLLNIKRRVDFLNGKLELSSILNKGTFVLISIPIK